MKSLRIRLVILLSALILVGTVVLFATLFRTAMGQANRLFDYHMQQIALALRDSSFERADQSPDKIERGLAFDFVIQIWSEEGARVYQSRTYRLLPDQAVMGYSTVKLINGEWVIYAVHTDNRVIQVAQLVKARRDRAIRLILNSLWPIIPMAFVLLAAIWWVISAALSPLNRIGAELGKRNATSLEPIVADDTPTEVAPLVKELNSLLARLNQAMASQQQFVADAAHELRSPLTALKLQAQALERAKTEPGRTQAITRLSGGIERAIRLVEQLLALARQDPLSQSTMSVEKIPLSLCVREAVSDMAILASSKGIDLSYEEQSEAKVIGDPESIRVLVRNIVDNAVRYTPARGTVKIFVGIENGTSVVTVADSGPSIPVEERARVFDRFYRVPGTYPTGSGLGLPIVKAIAERHSAIVSLENSIAGGLEVKVLFPNATPAAA